VGTWNWAGTADGRPAPGSVFAATATGF